MLSFFHYIALPWNRLFNFKIYILIMNDNFNIQSKDGKHFEIPLQGSLGLLALGYKGVKAWREVKWAHINNQNKQQTENSDLKDKK